MSADRVVQCMLAGMSERISPVSAMAFSTGPGNASYDLQDPVLTRQWIHIKDHQQIQTQHTHTQADEHLDNIHTVTGRHTITSLRVLSVQAVGDKQTERQ